MDINDRMEGDVAVVEIHGDIDTNTAPEAQGLILPVLEGNPKLLLDVTDVEYMSSAGLRVMLLLYRRVASQGGKIVLVGLSEEIRDTMDVTGFLGFFTTCDTIAEGVEALSS